VLEGAVPRKLWIDIIRVADGKLAEGWVELDALGWMQQLGAIPEPGQG
jgi:hypothetical protein